MNPIFECTVAGSRLCVGTDDGVNYYTIGAGHLLVVEMAKEIVRLRERVNELERGQNYIGEWQD